MAIDEQKEREAFETFIKGEPCSYDEMDLRKFSTGEYGLSTIQVAWRTWLAARAESSPPIHEYSLKPFPESAVDKTYFILSRPGKCPRVGRPIGPVSESLKEWMAANPDCEVTVIELAGAETRTCDLWASTASEWLLPEKVGEALAPAQDDSGKGNRQRYIFNRYRHGKQMAEGIAVHASSMEEAETSAKRMHEAHYDYQHETLKFSEIRRCASKCAICDAGNSIRITQGMALFCIGVIDDAIEREQNEALKQDYRGRKDEMLAALQSSSREGSDG